MYYFRCNTNHLQELPAAIFSNLENLAVLNLAGNKLDELPKNLFSNLNNLVGLDLRGNPFDPDFIDDLRQMIHNMPSLIILNNKSKDQALKLPPFSTLKEITVEKIAKNIDAYRNRLHLLPEDILELLPLTPAQRAGITAEKRQSFL